MPNPATNRFGARFKTRPWIIPIIRCAVYAYFAAGMALLLSDGAISAVRYNPDKRFAISFLLAVFVGIFGILAFANWDRFRQPISPRRWVLLCLLASLGIVPLILATPGAYGGSGT
jgi:hypothetical protein